MPFRNAREAQALGIARASDQVPKLAALAKKNGRPGFIGRGLNRWSNVHVEDLAALYLRALELDGPGGFHFVENGEAALGDVARAIGTRFGLPAAESITDRQCDPRMGRDDGASWARVQQSRSSRDRARCVRLVAATWLDYGMDHHGALRP